jgi:hypothetical protein
VHARRCSASPLAVSETSRRAASRCRAVSRRSVPVLAVAHRGKRHAGVRLAVEGASPSATSGTTSLLPRVFAVASAKAGRRSVSRPSRRRSHTPHHTVCPREGNSRGRIGPQRLDQRGADGLNAVDELPFARACPPSAVSRYWAEIGPAGVVRSSRARVKCARGTASRFGRARERPWHECAGPRREIDCEIPQLDVRGGSGPLCRYRDS